MIYILVILSIVTVLTYELEVLDLPGSITAFFMGLLFWYFGNVNYIVVIVFFMSIGWLVTKYKNEYKNEILSETSSQRKTANVIANGLSPLLFTLLGSPIAVFSAVSTALSDTMASELGVLSDNAYLLVNFKKVSPGVNGAVSFLGTIFSLVGAGLIGIFYFYISGGIFETLVIFISGYFGCLIDSFLGCTLERKGLINKFHVNLLATFSGGIIPLLLIQFL